MRNFLSARCALLGQRDTLIYTPPPFAVNSVLNRLHSLRPALFLLAAFLFFINPATALASDSANFAAAVEKGILYGAGVAFAGGLLVSLTPCVYPMIAITVAVFGAKQSQGRLHAFGLSSAFVLGIVAMFTPLGVFAGMTGSLFGSVLQSPWVLAGIAVLFVAMAASMLGAFELALPSSLTNKLAEVGGVGPKGAFGLGLVCGLIAAPCTGPVLTGILTWIAKTQSAAAGASAMAAFSLGLGLPFLLVGTFAVQLPKSGAWMVHVKSVLAIVLSVVALYFFNTAFPFIGAWIQPGTMTLGVAAAVIVFGLAIGAVHRDFHSPEWKDKFLKGLGVFVTTVAGFAAVIAMTTVAATEQLAWKKVPVETAQKTAVSDEKPLLVDFTAAWCGACKELDAKTFSDPKVSQEAGRFLAIKVDATDDEDPVVEKTMEDLNVVGLPTVVLFDSTGKEVKRFTDFVDAKSFLSALEAVN